MHGMGLANVYDCVHHVQGKDYLTYNCVYYRQSWMGFISNLMQINRLNKYEKDMKIKQKKQQKNEKRIFNFSPFSPRSARKN